MPYPQITQRELETAFGLNFPDTSVLEIKITTNVGGPHTFNGRITFQQGRTVETKAFNTSVAEITYFKDAVQGPCW